MNEPIEIAVLLYANVQMAAALGITDMLHAANHFWRERGETPEGALLRITHWSQEGADAPERVYDSLPDAPGQPAVIVLPPAMAPIQQETAQRYVDWLLQQRAAGATLASVCAGTFILCETGLLVGRTVTTHWRFEDALRTRFPAVRVDTQRLMIDDGDIVTSGGLMSWIDLTLKLIARFLGATIMIDTARAFVVDPPGREQAWYSAFAPKLNHGDADILKVQHWLQTADLADTDLETLGAQAGLEKRTLLRRFQKATGLTTTVYIQRLRVGRAQELLQFADLTLEHIAWNVGYADVGAFRKVFTRLVGLTPGDYRRRFRAVK